MRLDAVELLVAAGRATADRVQASLEQSFKALGTSGATRHLTAIVICGTQIAISAVGVFSLYESRLQSIYGWEQPLAEVGKILIASGAQTDARTFDDFRLAINVLKHGQGQSLAALLTRADQLSFEVQAAPGQMWEEDDVFPPTDLIIMTPKFFTDMIARLMQVGKLLIRRSKFRFIVHFSVMDPNKRSHYAFIRATGAAPTSAAERRSNSAGSTGCCR